jgi:hypothetical protein
MFSPSSISRWWRAAAVATLLPLATPLPAPAQSSDFGNSRYAQLSPKTAQEVLDDFRRVPLADTCFRFTLTHVPRRGGNETVHNGVMWTSMRDGPVFRVELFPAKDAKNSGQTGTTNAPPVRFILKSGKDAALWRLDGLGKPARVHRAADAPFLPGLIATPLELQQPFTYWSDIKYLETRRFRGRPTHFFQMNPPADFKLAHPGLGFVRIGIDRNYQVALMQAMIYDAKGEELRKLEVESFVKVKEVFIPEELRFHDQKTRDKDIFRVRSAAVKIRNNPSVFDPATLVRPAPQPDEKSFEKVD